MKFFRSIQGGIIMALAVLGIYYLCVDGMRAGNNAGGFLHFAAAAAVLIVIIQFWRLIWKVAP